MEQACGLLFPRNAEVARLLAVAECRFLQRLEDGFGSLLLHVPMVHVSGLLGFLYGGGDGRVCLLPSTELLMRNSKIPSFVFLASFLSNVVVLQ